MGVGGGEWWEKGLKRGVIERGWVDGEWRGVKRWGGGGRGLKRRKGVVGEEREGKVGGSVDQRRGGEGS